MNNTSDTFLNDSNLTNTQHLETKNSILLTCLCSFIIGIATMASFGNCVVFLTIMTTKELRTHFFVLVAIHTLAKFVDALAHIGNHTYSIITLYNPDIQIMTRIECHTLYLAVYFFDSYSSVMVLALAVDRFFAIVKPLFYMTLTPKSSQVAGTSLFLAVFLFHTCPSYIGNGWTSEIRCISGDSPLQPLWRLATGYFFLLTYILTFTVYVATFLFAWAIAKKDQVAEKKRCLRVDPSFWWAQSLY